MMSPDLPFTTSCHRTTSETEMTSFINSAQNSGLSTAKKRMNTNSKSSKITRKGLLVAMTYENAQGSATKQEEKNINSGQKQSLDT
jgi:hypothetical protein